MLNFFNTTYKGTGKNVVLGLFGFLIIVSLINYGIFKYLFPTQNKSSVSRIRLNDPSLKFINPLLAIDTGDKSEFKEYKNLENKITDYISSTQKSGSIYDTSVYYRDLTNGSWTGVNEDTKYSPGSLQKIPLMIAYLKNAEADPTILAKKLVYDLSEDKNTNQTIKPIKSIQSGQMASVLDLIKLMIIYSDNNATNILTESADPNSVKEVFSDLGISFNQDQTRTDYISTKQFSLFFRILYNSSYLNWNDSEEALDLLSQSDFKDGLVAGVPNNIVVAHKFGESFNTNDSLINGSIPEQLHDCGIIYYPNHPYILCVMTKGSKNLAVLENNIKSISQIVYQDVENRYH